MNHRWNYLCVLASIVLLLLASTCAMAASFTDIDAGIIGDSAGCVAWGDYDGDGDLDLAVAGGKGTYIYQNTNGEFINIHAPLPAVSWGAIAWADYDGDGDLDLALAGNTGVNTVTPIFHIYRNDKGMFFNADRGLPGIWNCSLAWGDIDNDGDLDLAAAGDTDALGAAPIATVFINDYDSSNHENKFTDSKANLFSSGITRGSLDWADYDNDGDLDLLAAGELSVADFLTNEYHVTKLFRNNDGKLEDTQQIIVGVNACKVTWGDFDNDGFFDFALAGATDGGTCISRVYKGDGFTFGPMDAAGIALPGVAWGSIAWGDYDNDGDFDLALAGNRSGDGAHGESKIFRNDSGTFVDIEAPLTAVAYASMAWGDLNNDGKLDLALTGHDYVNDVLFSKLYRNETPNTNEPPSAPVMLDPVVEGTGEKVTFSWLPAVDDHTPSGGLTYNMDLLAVNADGTARFVVSGMSYLNGKRQILAHGNMQKNLSWTIKGLDTQNNRYYWRIQAVDSAFAATEWKEKLVDAPVDDLKFDPAPGTYITSVDVAITSATVVADIHYTLDGSDPDESDPILKPGERIHLEKTTTIKARGYYGRNMTPILEGEFRIKVDKIKFDPDPQPEPDKFYVFDNEIDVNLTCDTPGATIHYTTDLSEPTEESPVFEAGNPIHLDADTFISSRGFKEGCDPGVIEVKHYVFKVATPVFTPDAGTYTTEQDVTVTCNTRGAVIHYTTNGVDPTENDPIVEHGKSVHIDKTMTLKAKAFYKTFIPSTVKSADYYMNLGPVFIPTFSPDGGTYITSVTVRITCDTPGAIIRYTTDGTNPTNTSQIIESGDTIFIDKTTTLKARAWKGIYVPSDIRTAIYEIKVAKPVIAPITGTYATGQTLQITCDTPGAVIHYTLNGNDPTESDPVFNPAGSNYLNTDHVVKAKAWKPGLTSSDINMETLTFNLKKSLVMVSLPIIPDDTDPKEVAGFYKNYWYVYRPESRTYSTYPEARTWLDPVESTPGRGFWACFDGQMVKPTGQALPQDKPAKVRLLPGWNIIGIPFLSAVKWDKNTVKVQVPGQSIKRLSESGDAVVNYLWGWQQYLNNPSRGAYYLVGDDTVKSRDTDTLQPWEGYWIKAKKECDLIIPPPTSN